MAGHGHWGDGRVTGDQVGLVGVAAQIGPDERTQGNQLEPTGAEVPPGRRRPAARPAPGPRRRSRPRYGPGTPPPGWDRYSISPARVVPSQSSYRDARGLSATRASVGMAITSMVCSGPLGLARLAWEPLTRPAGCRSGADREFAGHPARAGGYARCASAAPSATLEEPLRTGQ